MSNIVHKQELSQIVGDIMYKIDLLPLHPKNKCQLYNRYLLSKISWHLTVADLTKTWLSENLDNLVNKYFRSWLDLPISGTLSNVFLPRSKCGLSIQPPSIKHAQCQIVICNALKSSRNEGINTLWKNTATSTNSQYDQYKSTKDNVCQKYLERLYSFKNFLPPSCFRGINENVHPLPPLYNVGSVAKILSYLEKYHLSQLC